MESIIPNSSLQREPVPPAASEYEEITFTHDDSEVKQKSVPPSKNEPMFPPPRVPTVAKEEKPNEVIYEEPQFQKHHGQNKQTSSISAPPEPVGVEYAIPKPEQFGNYTDEELEELAFALSKVLKIRKHPSEKNMRTEDDRTLDQSQHKPIDDRPSSPIEVPPPIPIKKRRRQPQHEHTDGISEKDLTSKGMLALIMYFYILFCVHMQHLPNKSQIPFNLLATSESGYQGIAGENRYVSPACKLHNFSAYTPFPLCRKNSQDECPTCRTHVRVALERALYRFTFLQGCYQRRGKYQATMESKLKMCAIDYVCKINLKIIFLQL